MLSKYIAVVALCVVLGVALLDLRQRRIDAMHEMARMHQQMNASRKAIWTHQADLANELRPAELAERVNRSGLELEPLMPQPAAYRRGELERMDADH